MMMKKSTSKILVLAVSLMTFVNPMIAGTAYSKEKKMDSHGTSHEPKTKRVIKQKSERKSKPVGMRKAKQPTSQAQQYCANIRDDVLEKRYAMKRREVVALHEDKKLQLEELRAEIQKRIDTLEVKRVDFEKWVVKREKFSAMATDSIVDIYTKMRPDAAASRLEELGDMLAAAILLKMSSRKAGVILNEMKAKKAAEITKVIASSGRKGEQT